MINFSAISNKSLIGKFLRGILKFTIPKKIALPILQGKLKGRKWIIGSGVFGYWLGTYELEKQKIFEKTVEKGNVVYDIGANAGFYSLLAAELVGPNGKVFSFEPLPRNIFYLKKHIKINKFSNVIAIESAVSDKKGELSFIEGESNAIGRLSKDGQLKVTSVVLDDLLKDKKILAPNVLKIDVEGAEYQVLIGVEMILKKYRPKIFLSTHNSEIHKKCCDFLLMFGYKLIPIGCDNFEQATEILATY